VTARKSPAEGPGNLIFVDCEFLEEGQGWGRGVELLSLGAVRADGSTYYAETKEGRVKAGSLANTFVREHVMPQLWKNELRVKPRAVLAEQFADWVGPKPIFWGYMAAYDWVTITGLYGAMAESPADWPYFIRDLAQLAEAKKGDPEWPEKAVPHRGDWKPHHALTDAIWTWDAWRILQGLSSLRLTNQGAHL
jgi:hypothetical protein